MATFTINSNVPVAAKSQVYIPNDQEFTLFFDSENSLHLTAAKRIGSSVVFYDYETVAPGGLVYIGTIDASTNPNFPAAEVGDVYVVSVSGSICNQPVVVGDMLISKANQVTGCVINNWDIVKAENSSLISGTFAQIQNLVTGNLLIAGNIYKITNPFGSPQGLGSSLFQFTYSILLTATSSNTFSSQGVMECVFINDGNRKEIYDVNYNYGVNDLAAIVNVIDIRNNSVCSSSFAAFQFGNNNVNSNIISDASNVILQNGSIENSGNVIGNIVNNSNVNMSSNTGNVSQNNFLNGSVTLTNNTINIIGNIIKNGSMNINTPTADILYNKISGFSLFSVANNSSEVSRNNILGGSVLFATSPGGEITRNSISNGSNFAIDTNTNEISRNNIMNNSIFSLTTPQGPVVYNNIFNSSIVSVTSNTLDFSSNVFSGASIGNISGNSGIMQNNSINTTSIFHISNCTHSVSNNTSNNSSIITCDSLLQSFLNNNVEGNSIFDVQNSTAVIQNNSASNGGLYSIANVNATFQNNSVNSGIFSTDTTTGVIERNFISSSGTISLDHTTHNIATNNIDSNSILSLTTTDMVVIGNYISNNSSINIQNAAVGAFLNFNNIVVSVFSITGGSGIVSQNRFNNISFSQATNQGTIQNNIFENISLVNADLNMGNSFTKNNISNIPSGSFDIPNNRNISNKYYNGVISNFDTTVTVAPASGIASLAANNYDVYCGIVNIDFAAAAETISQFSGGNSLTINYQLQPVNGKTLTITATAIGAIGADQIATTGFSPVLIGRTNAPDYFTVIKDGTFNRQTNSSILA